MAYRKNEEWSTCHCCGGDVPPEPLWGKRGEASDGYCRGWVRPDGMRSAFARRESYKEKKRKAS